MPPIPVSVADILYAFCSLLLLGAAGLVWLRDRHAPANRRFALAALSLLAWVATLFLFNRAADPAAALWLGRANFAAVVPAAFFGYQFVRAVAGPPHRSRNRWEAAAALLLTVVTFFTALVDREEIVGAGPGGRPATAYGPLFPAYLLAIGVWLGAAVFLAFRSRPAAREAARQDQLALIGAGMLGTGAVTLMTNAFLPYALANFRWVDVGPLSTVLFLLAVGYAVVRHRLFDVRVFVRRTLVLGLLLSLATAAYGAVVTLATERLAGSGAGTLTRFGVLMIALSFDPLRRALEKRADRMLFRK